MDAAKDMLLKADAELKALADLLPEDEWSCGLVVDTNPLSDNPDLAAFRTAIGPRYMGGTNRNAVLREGSLVRINVRRGRVVVCQARRWIGTTRPAGSPGPGRRRR